MKGPVFTVRCVPPLLSLVCLIAWSGCALAQNYAVTVLNPIVGPNTDGLAINASGQVVGQTFTFVPADPPLNNNFVNVGNAFVYSRGVSQNLGTLGGSGSAAQSINVSGDVAGFAQTTGNTGNHAFLYKNGVMQDLGTFGGTTSQAYSINASDQVTGLSKFADELTLHAFIYSHGTMQDLGALGGNFSVGHAINDSGHVAGEVQPLGKVLQAFLYRDGVMQALGTLGGSSSQAYGISASDQVTGKSDVSMNDPIVHAFLYSNGLMKDLGTLGGTHSVGFGINSSGQIVGQSATAGNVASHAFLYTNGKMVDLNSLLPNSAAALYTLTSATSINDSGQIVASGYLNSTYSTSPDQRLAFLLTPAAAGHKCADGDEIGEPEKECEPGHHQDYEHKAPLDQTEQLSHDKRLNKVPEESHTKAARVFEGGGPQHEVTTQQALRPEGGMPDSAIASAAKVQVYVSYAENQSPAFFFPNPWYGSPNTQFLGHPGSAYNTGGILIANTGATNVVLAQGAWVDGFHNGKVYRLWDSFIPAQGRNIPPGSRLILAQTTACTQGGPRTCSDFDTSDTTVGSVPTTNTPVIHLTLNGTAQSFTDTGQILNTGGVDIGTTLKRNESMQWRLVGTTSPLFPGGSGVLPAPVSTSHNDNSRTGLASSETTLNSNNVNAVTFGKLFAYPVDGAIWGQPLFVRDVLIRNRGLHNVVVVATSNNSVYAFDAENNHGNGGLLWGPISLGPPSPPFGVRGTPVIDIASGTIYLVSKNNLAVGNVARLHALDLTSGAERIGSPVVIEGTVPGTGDDSIGGNVPFKSKEQAQQSALLLTGTSVYIAFGSIGDRNPNHGWLFGYDGKTFAQTAIYNTSPNAVGHCDVYPPPAPPNQCAVPSPTQYVINPLCPNTKNPGWAGFLPAGGTIWMAGAGPAADAAGIYVTTGNGFFDASKSNFADSVLKLSKSGASTQLTVADYFTPSNQLYLMCNDADLGAGGPLLLPGTNPSLLLQISKRGNMYLINRATGSMGGYNSTCSPPAPSCDHVVQAIGNAIGADVVSSPAYFNGAVYIQGENGTLKKFTLRNGAFSPITPTAQTAQRFTFAATPSVSYDGTATTPTLSGIVWSIERLATKPAVLHAYAADTLRELYRSDSQGTRDTLGTTVSFTVPTIAAGKVFVGTTTQLVVYGGI